MSKDEVINLLRNADMTEKKWNIGQNGSKNYNVW